MTEEPVTVRVWGEDHPIPVTVSERRVTRWDAQGRAYRYVVLGVGPA